MLSIKTNQRKLKQSVGKLVKPLWEINKCPISDEPDKDDEQDNDPTVVLIHRATCLEIKNYEERFKYSRKRVDEEDSDNENISNKKLHN